MNHKGFVEHRSTLCDTLYIRPTEACAKGASALSVFETDQSQVMFCQYYSVVTAHTQTSRLDIRRHCLHSNDSPAC